MRNRIVYSNSGSARPLGPLRGRRCRRPAWESSGVSVRRPDCPDAGVRPPADALRQAVDHFETLLPTTHLREALVAKEFDITNEGVPWRIRRFTRRPSAKMKIECPSGKVNLSTCGLMFSFTAADFSRRAIWNLVVEMADVADDGLVAHLLHMFQRDDVAVAGASDVDVALGERALSTVHLKPSIAACKAQMGSISVTITRAVERIERAHPCPRRRNRTRRPPCRRSRP